MLIIQTYIRKYQGLTLKQSEDFFGGVCRESVSEDEYGAHIVYTCM
jgi:hypothetical protein